LVRDIGEVGALHVRLLLHLAVGVLLLAQFHRFNRAWLVCFHSKNRERGADEHNLAELVQDEFNFVGQVLIASAELHRSALLMLQDNEGSFVEIDDLTSVDIGDNAGVAGAIARLLKSTELNAQGHLLAIALNTPRKRLNVLLTVQCSHEHIELLERALMALGYLLIL